MLITHSLLHVREAGAFYKRALRRWPVLVALLLVGLGAMGCRPRVDGSPVDPAMYQRPVRVSCIGDSLTTCDTCWPTHLTGMLGPRWEVLNHGFGCSTILSFGDTPYVKHRFPEVLASEPDVVVILMGTNDSKPRHWYYKEDFEKDYGRMLKDLQALPTRPRIWVCLPPPCFPGQWGIDEGRLQEMRPVIQRVARRHGVPVIDLRTPFENRGDQFPDQIHPSEQVSVEIAAIIAKAVAGR